MSTSMFGEGQPAFELLCVQLVWGGSKDEADAALFFW